MATIKRITLRWAATHAVYLGRRGENLARTIEIDATPMAEEFPGCTFALLAQRPTEPPAYAATITAEGGIISWPITDVDTGIAGSGRIELRAMLGDVVAKSVTMATVTDKSLDAPTDTDPPEPEHGWLDQALAAQAGAEAAAADAKETLAEVEKKLADGELKGEKGDPGKDGKDAEVTAESIEAALGYKPPKVGAASSGIITDTSGALAINPASTSIITSRSTSQPITAPNLDYAIKAAMCDGKGAAWTAAEQQAARDRMGLDKPWELIEEVEFTEEAASLWRTAEPDGTNYSFSAMLVHVGGDFKNAENIKHNIYALVYFGSTDTPNYIYFYMQISPQSSAKVINTVVTAKNINGYWQCLQKPNDNGGPHANGSWLSDIQITNPSARLALSVAALPKITQIQIVPFTDDKVIQAGTTIRIYGVRA